MAEGLLTSGSPSAAAAAARLRRLVETGIAFASELSVDAVLEATVRAAAELTGARYAALGVIDPTGRELERFLTHGIDPQAHAAIGELPRGRGILGVLIKEVKPLRLHDLTQDERAVGFPPNHPPMTTFLGVPILLRGVAYGNLYLTEKEGEADFTEEDEEIVTLLASQAAVAIENTRLYEAATRMSERMRTLLDAEVTLSSELSLDSLLQRVTETAAELTGARYAALGVIDPTGRELERFLTHGIDPQAHAAIGELPRGRGILGVLIKEVKPLRLHDLTQDERAVGFPPNHPPMTTFLGVPILLRGVAYGNLYLTEKEGEADFTEEDEEIVTLLASQAAVAIENTRLYEAAMRWSQQLESLMEVGNALATEIDRQSVLDLVTRRLRELTEARIVMIWLATREGTLRVEAASGGGAKAVLGLESTRADSKTGRVFESGRSARVDSVLDDPEVNQQLARRMGLRAALWVPLLARGQRIGVIVAADKAGKVGFSDADLRLVETFATRTALAVDLSDRVARDSLRQILEAQELERGRLARELHDETGQALTSILLGLKAADSAESLEDVQARTAQLRDLVTETLKNVRRLAVELRPSALDDFGLVAGLERLIEGLADRTGIRVSFDQRLGDTRIPSEVETTLYRIVQEALTNVVKHAQAEHVSVALTTTGSSVTVVIKDDGRGFTPASPGNGFGLVGMRERVALVEGRLEIQSTPGAGTTLIAEVPIP